MIKVSEEGMSKAESSQKLGLCQTVVVIAKKKFLKETKSATPVNTRMIRMQNSLMLRWTRFPGLTEGWISHNIPLGQSLIKSKALTLHSSMEAEGDEETLKVWS